MSVTKMFGDIDFISFFLFVNVCTVVGKVTANVRVLAEKGNLKNVSTILAQMYNRITNVQLLTSAPFLPIPVSHSLFLIFLKSS
jgi:hypothetical protein